MRHQKKHFYTYLFLIIIGLIFILNFIGGDYLKNLTYTVFNPLQNFLQKQTFNAKETFSSWFLSKKELQSKIEKLTNENSFLVSKINQTESIREENNNLREALSLDLNKDIELVEANKINFFLEEDEILINKGEKEGLQKEQAVITPDRELVGKITEVYPHYSRIKTIFSYDSSWPVFIYNQEKESRIEGVVRGQKYPFLELDLVPIQSPLQKNDFVVTQENKSYPADLIIGRISEINFQDLESFKKATVVPRINLNKLSLLFIIKSF